MNAGELFQAGRLQEALEAQIQKVRANPDDMGARLFLFELLLFAGDADRAAKHLDALHYDNPRATASVEMYRLALNAEKARREVLAGRDRPKVLAEQPDHVSLRMEALQRYAAGQRAEGDALLDRANDEAPKVRGLINGRPVEGLRDADDLFGTVLEVFGGGGVYCWVPLEQVESLTMKPPAAPRDVLFIPANLALSGGPSGDVMLPGLYPDSFKNTNDAVRLGRDTEWVGPDDGPARGAGGRLFLAGEEPFPLIDWREFQSA